MHAGEASKVGLVSLYTLYIHVHVSTLGTLGTEPPAEWIDK